MRICITVLLLNPWNKSSMHMDMGDMGNISRIGDMNSLYTEINYILN